MHPVLVPVQRRRPRLLGQHDQPARAREVVHAHRRQRVARRLPLGEAIVKGVVVEAHIEVRALVALARVVRQLAVEPQRLRRELRVELGRQHLLEQAISWNNRPLSCVS